jgi:hypothetical protein
VLIVVAAFVIWAMFAGRSAPPRPQPTKALQPSGAGTGESTKPTGSEPRSSAPPSTTPKGNTTAVAPTVGGESSEGASKSKAKCEVKNPRWYVLQDGVVVKGEVVNVGTEPADEAQVLITIADARGDLVLGETTPVVPQRLRPDYSGRFRAELKLPPFDGPADVKAQAQWR